MLNDSMQKSTSKSKKIRMNYKERTSKGHDSSEAGLSKFHSESQKKNDMDPLSPTPRNQQLNLFSDVNEQSVHDALHSGDMDNQEQKDGEQGQNENIEKLLSNALIPLSPKLEKSEIHNSQQVIPLENQSNQQIVHQQTQARKKQTLFKTQKTFRLIKNLQVSLKQPKKSASNAQEKTFINLKLITQIKVKMIYFFKKFTQSGRMLLLEQNKKVRQVINDKCDMGKQQTRDMKGSIKKFFSLKEEEIQEIQLQSGDSFMIPPSSFLSILFLITFTTTNIIFLLLLSIILIFQQPEEYEPLFDKIMLVAWGCEIIAHLNTQVYEKNYLINNRRMIILLYLRDRAIFDMIPLISTVSMPSQIYIHKIMQGITFIKLNNIFRDVNLMQKYLCMTVKNYYIVQLFNLIVKLFILGHIIACMWYLIGQLELNLLNAETTWYDVSLGADYVWWKLYLESMYWALTLMTTGSNVGTSIVQLFFTTFIMLFTTIIFGYMLNTTGTILSQLNQQDENKRIDLNIINDYMRANKISKTLQGRVNQDIENYYLNNLKKEQEENQQVLKKISPHLNRLLKLEHCRQYLEKFVFLDKKFSKETLDELCMELQEEYYTPNQWLFKENQYNDISLIFIVKGSVSLIKQPGSNEGEHKCIKQVRKGSILGQVSFFTGMSYHVGAKSTEFTKVIRISRDKFLEIIQKNKKDSEIFCLMRDKQAIYEEYNISESRCFFCNSSTHLPTDCHLVHIQRSEILQKAKMYDGKPQIRQLFKRSNNTTNSYFIQNDIQKQILKYMWNLRREQRMQKKQVLKAKQEEESQSNSSDDFSQSAQSNYSSENDIESSEESFQIQVKNARYFEQGKALKEIVRQQQMNGNKAKKQKESLENIQLSNLPNSPNKFQYSNNVPNSLQSIQQIDLLALPQNLDNRNNYQNYIGNYNNTNNYIGYTKNNWAIQEVESPSSRQHRQSFSQREKDGKQMDSFTIIGNINKKRASKYQPILSDKAKAYTRQKIFSSNTQNELIPQKPSEQIQDSRKSKLKSQFMATKQFTIQNQTLVVPQVQQAIPLVDEEKEKKRTLNLLEFDKMKDWVYYFPQGNYKNIILKYYRYIKKKKLKNTIRDLTNKRYE